MSKETQVYIDTVQDDRRDLLLKLKKIIQEVYPEMEPEMWYHIVTYRKAKGWRKWVGLGYRKDGVTLYTNGSHMDSFKKNHPNMKTGKGSLQFKPGDKIPVEDLKTLIKNAVEDTQEIK
jgi:uncharacterized protein YdhG (YjbR/CyaY superfamily)